MTVAARTADYSLQTRLLFAFSGLLFVFLGLTGLVLDSAFRNSIEAGAAERLQVQIYLILAAAEEEAGEFYFLQDLQEPRFSQLNSGLYGFINKPSLGELWRSKSARTFNLADPDILNEHLGVGEARFTTASGEQGDIYFVLSYGILWQDGINEYSFSVVESAAPYYSEISNFRTSLWYWLGGVAALLLLMQFLLLRWGLLPLHRMASDLKEIEAGNKDHLAGHYPKELRGVTDNLNLLIEKERKQQTRYRTTLGDLAHSLKTPLAVISGIIQNLARSPAGNEGVEVGAQLGGVEEQLERMNQIVTYQLQRAVQTHQPTTLGRQVNVAAATQRILDALRKVYADKAMHSETRLDPAAIFYGDERDLMELVGNVLDNAFKYGRSRVRVTASSQSGGAGDRAGLRLAIEDDGPGIPEDKVEYVLQRGGRADTLLQGQGIGLAVVTDIVSSYKGTVRVGRSELGGVLIEMLFNTPTLSGGN